MCEPRGRGGEGYVRGESMSGVVKCWVLSELYYGSLWSFEVEVEVEVLCQKPEVRRPTPKWGVYCVLHEAYAVYVGLLRITQSWRA